MARKISFDAERKAIADDEQKLVQRRARLQQLEQQERVDLVAKSVLAQVELEELKGFLDAVKKLGFNASLKRLA